MVALLSKSRLMLSAQLITEVTNGVGGEVTRESKQEVSHHFVYFNC